MKLKQIFCIHWFDIPIISNHTEAHGVIVCNEQRIFTIIKETRKCCKCSYEETRILSSECIGWE